MRQVVNRKRAEANNVKNGNDDILSIIVDGNSLLKMSLVDKRMNDKGQEYGAVFLFLRQLGNLLQKRDFNHCICCWDGDFSGKLRHDIYSEYKANRDKHYELVGGTSEYDKAIANYVKKVLDYSKQKKGEKVKRSETDDENFQRQRWILQNILENLYVRQFMYDEVEGDDLIAYYTKNKLPNEKIVIVSGDRDLTQLINDDICQYIPSLKKFVTPKNSEEILGITHENTVLKKIICGDASDNIKGIKGIGEQTLIKLIPEIKSRRLILEDVVSISQDLLDRRKLEHKKPLKSLENIVNCITDGVQGKDIYEINKKIIDLSEPLLTDEAKEGMDDEMHIPMSNEGRDIKNIYELIEKEGMSELSNEKTFGNLFGYFERVIKAEQSFLKKSV